MGPNGFVGTPSYIYTCNKISLNQLSPSFKGNSFKDSDNNLYLLSQINGKILKLGNLGSNRINNFQELLASIEKKGGYNIIELVLTYLRENT